jgi:hypothetical protein
MVTRRAATKGFKRTASLLTGQIRQASENRGFAESRLLMDWTEVIGPDIAAVARPVEVSYGRGGLGATLTLLTTGANAPILEMQKEDIRKKVNSVYGFNAITRIRITQTASMGFVKGCINFDHKNKEKEPLTLNPIISKEASNFVAPIEDNSLRAALQRLGTNILTKEKQGKRT